MINVSNLIGGVVHIPPPKLLPVEGLSWDITLGTAGTGLGHLILEKTSSSEEMVPEAIDHVGIVVYGHLYEYGDLGILKTAAPLHCVPESKYPVFNLRDRELLGETEKCKSEFEQWVELMNETEFLGANYNVVTRSCVVFGIRACEFLGVEHPENWDKICNWAQENSKVANLVGGSGINSRKLQIKAQASNAPKAIANYFKKKLKRRKHKTTDDGSSPSSSTSSSRASSCKSKSKFNMSSQPTNSEGDNSSSISISYSGKKVLYRNKSDASSRSCDTSNKDTDDDEEDTTLRGKVDQLSEDITRL